MLSSTPNVETPTKMRYVRHGVTMYAPPDPTTAAAEMRSARHVSSLEELGNWALEVEHTSKEGLGRDQRQPAGNIDPPNQVTLLSSAC